MDIEQVIKLINTVSVSELSEFKYEDENCKLTFKADRGTTYIKQTEQEGIVESVPAQKTIQPAVNTTEIVMGVDTQDEGNAVTAPLVGTFYRSSSPDQKAFVSVGDRVKKGQVIGIIEAMKLMNEVESEYEGVVESILVDNEQMVEYGQPLMIIK